MTLKKIFGTAVAAGALLVLGALGGGAGHRAVAVPRVQPVSAVRPVTVVAAGGIARECRQAPRGGRALSWRPVTAPASRARLCPPPPAGRRPPRGSPAPSGRGTSCPWATSSTRTGTWLTTGAPTAGRGDGSRRSAAPCRATTTTTTGARPG